MSDAFNCVFRATGFRITQTPPESILRIKKKNFLIRRAIIVHYILHHTSPCVCVHRNNIMRRKKCIGRFEKIIPAAAAAAAPS